MAPSRNVIDLTNANDTLPEIARRQMNEVHACLANVDLSLTDADRAWLDQAVPAPFRPRFPPVSEADRQHWHRVRQQSFAALPPTLDQPLPNPLAVPGSSNWYPFAVPPNPPSVGPSQLPNNLIPDSSLWYPPAVPPNPPSVGPSRLPSHLHTVEGTEARPAPSLEFSPAAPSSSVFLSSDPMDRGESSWGIAQGANFVDPYPITIPVSFSATFQNPAGLSLLMTSRQGSQTQPPGALPLPLTSDADSPSTSHQQRLLSYYMSSQPSGQDLEDSLNSLPSHGLVPPSLMSELMAGGYCPHVPPSVQDAQRELNAQRERDAQRDARNSRAPIRDPTTAATRTRSPLESRQPAEGRGRSRSRRSRSRSPLNG